MSTDNKKLAEYLGERLRWNVPQLEKYLDEFNQPILDYEIIEFRSTKNKNNPYNVWVLNDENKYQCHKGAVDFSLNEMLYKNRCVETGDIEIHSVKRLSDNEAFTIGDKVYWYIEMHNDTTTITEFRLVEDKKLNVYGEGFGIKLSEIKKAESKHPLFTTTDGKDIYEDYNGKIFRVFISNSSFEMWKVYDLGMPQYPNNEERYFVSGEAAHEYLYTNKPCLSVNDINELFEGWAHKPNEYVFNRIKELAKQKIKNQ